MIKHIRQPGAKTVSAACLIVLGAGFTAAPTAADRDVDGVVAIPPADECAVFIDYKEMDFIIFWQKYHMYDHGAGFEDPAEMEAPWGEWRPEAIVIADGPRHGLEEGWTLEHGHHTECPWIPTWMR